MKTVKKSFLTLGTLMFLIGALAIQMVTARVAYAQEILSYSAKFICGSKNGDFIQTVAGVYGTSINIHNPQEFTVGFNKKAVIALPQRRERGKISPFVQEFLRPDEAMGVDCQDIRKLYLVPPGGFIEGFLVLRVPTETGAPPMELDVVGVYTARQGPGQVETIDVEEVRPKLIMVPAQ